METPHAYNISTTHWNISVIAMEKTRIESHQDKRITQTQVEFDGMLLPTVDNPVYSSLLR